MTQVIPEEVLAPGPDLKRMLDEGGRVDVTVRSRKSGVHVKVSLACKKRRPEGRGYLPRNSMDGRVGYGDADKIDVTDPDLEYPVNKIGAYGKRSDRFYAERGADPARLWAAEKVVAFALGRFPLDEQAEVLMATRCCVCAKRLTDPVSVARMVGPECYGRRTGSRAAPRERLAA